MGAFSGEQTPATAVEVEVCFLFDVVIIIFMRLIDEKGKKENRVFLSLVIDVLLVTRFGYLIEGCFCNIQLTLFTW